MSRTTQVIPRRKIARLLLKHGQKFILYPWAFIPPHPRDVWNPFHFGIPYEPLKLSTPDKVTLECHLMLLSLSQETWLPAFQLQEPELKNYPETGRATVIMFHANGVDHGHIIGGRADRFLCLGCNVLTVSYRGYGNSTGSPSEAGLKIDAQTALDYVLRHELLSALPIIVYGQSLGGAVAIDLVSRNTDKISALIVENVFMSIPLRVQDFPKPFNLLSFACSQNWPSIKRIQNIPKCVPILMLGGDRDDVVPPRHLQALWSAALTRGDGTSRRSCGDILRCLEVVLGDRDLRDGKDMFRLFAGADHSSTCRNQDYWPQVDRFLEAALDMSPAESKVSIDDSDPL